MIGSVLINIRYSRPGETVFTHDQSPQLCHGVDELGLQGRQDLLGFLKGQVLEIFNQLLFNNPIHGTSHKTFSWKWGPLEGEDTMMQTYLLLNHVLLILIFATLRTLQLLDTRLLLDQLVMIGSLFLDQANDRGGGNFKLRARSHDDRDRASG
jgi:hypothetical protein